MIAALVLGLLNTLLRPLLVLLTLPVTLLTLGLFLFVINALMFYFAASLLDGFNVTGFGAALIGSLIYSLCGMVIDAAMERLFYARAPSADALGVRGQRLTPAPRTSNATVCSALADRARAAQADAGPATAPSARARRCRAACRRASRRRARLRR